MSSYNDLPLKGVKVVDLSTYAAVPVVGRIMADWGADVIKVEPLAGDPMRHFGPTLGVPSTTEENPIYDMLNGYKRYIAIDLKSEQGRKVMDDLLAQADVFITNVRINALKKMKLTYEDLSPRFPQLVWGHISGFGTLGPDRDRPGFDIVSYWARSGAMVDLCQPGSGPITPPYGFGDVPSGTTLLAGVCAALAQQRVTGRGRKVSASLYGSAIWNVGMMIATAQDAYRDPWPRSRKNPPSPLSSAFQSKDGEWLILGILEPARYWAPLCENVINRPDLAYDDRFNSVPAAKAHADILVDILDEAFAQEPIAVWEERLSAADIAYDRVSHFREVPHDPQAWANGYLTEATFRNGKKAVLPNTPVQFDDTPAPLVQNVGLIGQDTRAILKELNYSDEQIEEMFAAGVAAETK